MAPPFRRPSPALPARYPLADPLHQVLRVGHEQHDESVAPCATTYRARRWRRSAPSGCSWCRGRRPGRRAARCPRPVRTSISPPAPPGFAPSRPLPEAALIEVHHGDWRFTAPITSKLVDVVERKHQLLAGHRQESDEGIPYRARSPTRRASTTYSVPRRMTVTRSPRRAADSRRSMRSGCPAKRHHRRSRHANRTRRAGDAATDDRRCQRALDAQRLPSRAGIAPRRRRAGGRRRSGRRRRACRSVSLEPRPQSTLARASRFRRVPPGTTPRWARSRAIGRSGSASSSISAPTPLAISMLCR